jgi:hypothetical protein
MRNYGKGNMVYVPFTRWGNLKYGFRCRIKESYFDDLGIIKINPSGTGFSIQGLAIGVNSPKPPRATKITVTGTETSFCDEAKIPTLLADDWEIKGAKIRGISDSSFAKAVYVTINGIKYAWMSAEAPINPPGYATADIKPVGDNDLVVIGASFPKPPRMKVNLKETTGAPGSETTSKLGTFSTFVDPTKVDDLTSLGWRLTARAKNTVQDLQTML